MNPYFYRITIDRVLDGDTISAVFDLGFNIKMTVRVRMIGYDAPETWRPKSDAELQAGIRVKEELKYLLSLYAGNLYCESTDIDLYGRSSGNIYYKVGAIYYSINNLISQFIVNNNLTKGGINGTGA